MITGTARRCRTSSCFWFLYFACTSSSISPSSCSTPRPILLLFGGALFCGGSGMLGLLWSGAEPALSRRRSTPATRMCCFLRWPSRVPPRRGCGVNRARNTPPPLSAPCKWNDSPQFFLLSPKMWIGKKLYAGSPAPARRKGWAAQHKAKCTDLSGRPTRAQQVCGFVTVALRPKILTSGGGRSTGWCLPHHRRVRV